ncbi:unnamed protein product [Phytophthora lilii]|uniref:Unnamed protein product n=1 Tax=Phytophthora lilii TaxID=2077276 RepID=A0A9W6TII0_9STRA|nr:unnamed protein product [Phytophthora lilii]
MNGFGTAPKVTCLTRVWHPNIDVATGRVMMAIIGQDWGPVLNISTVLFGLQVSSACCFAPFCVTTDPVDWHCLNDQLIFLEPNISYVLNPTAAEMLHQDPEKFRTDAQRILCGGRFYGYDFPPHPRVIEKQRQGWGLRVKRPRHDESPDASSEWDSMASPNASDILGIEAPEIMENETTPTWKRARFQNISAVRCCAAGIQKPSRIRYVSLVWHESTAIPYANRPQLTEHGGAGEGGRAAAEAASRCAGDRRHEPSTEPGDRAVPAQHVQEPQPAPPRLLLPEPAARQAVSARLQGGGSRRHLRRCCSCVEAARAGGRSAPHFLEGAGF